MTGPIVSATVLTIRPGFETDHQKYGVGDTRCVRVAAGRIRPGVKLSPADRRSLAVGCAN